MVEEGGEMIVDVTEVVDSDGSHQQIYLHQPMTSMTTGGGNSQTYTVVQGNLENQQHLATSHSQPTPQNVHHIAGFEVMYSNV